VIPFTVQLGLYISPVGFSSMVVPEKWRLLYSLNPAVGSSMAFDGPSLEGNRPSTCQAFLLSWSVIGFFLWLGVRQFRKMENSFADFI